MMMTARALLDENPDPERGRDPRGHLRPDLPLHRLQEHRPRHSVGGRACHRTAGAGVTTIEPSRRHRRARPEARSASAECCARRTRASSAARATTSTTSGCRGCCTGPSCVSPTRTRGSSRIDTTAAQAHPKVKAVVTGADLATKGLAWMPTLSNDIQAVLATDKVRFQGQEVAFVVAEDRVLGPRCLELIDVEYEPLPAVDRRPHGARPRRAGDPRRPGRPDRQPLLRLGGRRRGGHRRASSPRPTSSSSRTSSTRACTRRRWRPAVRSPTWTR